MKAWPALALAALAAVATLALWSKPVSKRGRDRVLVHMPAPEAAQAEPLAEPTEAGAASADVEREMTAEELYGDRSVDSLLARLDSTDPFVVLDAADGLRARRVTAAIPKLAAFDIVANTDAARTVIHSLGQLAGMASAPERAVATRRLGALLAQEKQRKAPEAVGNVLQIYEALGDAGDPSSAALLERELLDPDVPLSTLIEVIASLVRLHQPSSREALLAARPRIAALRFDDEFEREIQADVLMRLDAAISVL